MMNFDYIFNDIFDSFNDLSPITYYTSVSGFPTEKEIVNAIVDTPLAFNLKTDSNKECKLELAMAGVKKENLKITKKGRTFTITCVGTESKKDEDKNEDKKVAVFKKGLKVPSEKDIASTFDVPEIFDVDKAKFDYTDGLLTIVVPLKDEEKPRDIKF